MAVNSLNDYSTTPSSNADIAGTNIAIGCPPQDVGVFMRTIMAQIAYAVQGTGGPIPATWNVGTLTAASISSASSFTVSGTLSATTVAASGNITVGGTLTAASIGGVSSLSVAGVTASAGVTSTGYDAGGANFRATNGSYGVFLRNDGTTANLLQTASGSPTGTFNTFRPLSWNLGSGAVTIDGTAAGATMGGALTVGGLLTTSALSVSGTSAFTGATTAPTVGAGTNNASVATAAFVQNAMLGGTGQSWTDVTASRALNTLYTNSSLRPIFVTAAVSGATNIQLGFIVGSVTFSQAWAVATGSQIGDVAFIVPAGGTYQVTSPVGTLIQWAELR